MLRRGSMGMGIVWVEVVVVVEGAGRRRLVRAVRLLGWGSMVSIVPVMESIVPVRSLGV